MVFRKELGFHILFKRRNLLEQTHGSLLFKLGLLQILVSLKINFKRTKVRSSNLFPRVGSSVKNLLLSDANS